MMNISTNIWHWTTVAAILGMWSFLYKENPAFRVAEHVFVGSTAGHALGMAICNIYRFGWNPLVHQQQLLLFVPLILGLLLYARFFPSMAWLSRWPVAFLVGVGTGQSIYNSIRTQVINQSIGAMNSLTGGSLGQSLNAIIAVVGLLAVLTYFLFSIPQSKPVKSFGMVGRWIMMITFGVSFGNVVAGRISVLLGELTKIFGDALGML
jgi:hypothetical protein